MGTVMAPPQHLVLGQHELRQLRNPSSASNFVTSLVETFLKQQEEC